MKKGKRVGKHKKRECERKITQSEILKMEKKRQKTWCRLCNKDRDHFEDNCPLFARCPELAQIRKENLKLTPGKGGRCPLCAGLNHRTKTCEYYWVLSVFLASENEDTIISFPHS